MITLHSGHRSAEPNEFKTESSNLPSTIDDASSSAAAAIIERRKAKALKLLDAKMVELSKSQADGLEKSKVISSSISPISNE